MYFLCGVETDVGDFLEIGIKKKERDRSRTDRKERERESQEKHKRQRETDQESRPCSRLSKLVADITDNAIERG